MFVHTPHSKKNAFAFLPHTFRYLGGNHNIAKYALTFYRHEGTAVKPVATFGGLWVMLDPARIQGDPAKLTYQGLLSSATRGQYPDRSDMSVNGVWKLGHARPWTSQIHLEPNGAWNNTPLVERSDLNVSELEQMLKNLQHQPAGTDAWYVFKKH